MTAISSASSSSITTSFNYERRMEELRQKVKFFESRLGISKTVNLSIGDFSSSPCALASGNIVKVPTWMLFQNEDIPLHLRITEFRDPRLSDQNFLNQLATWMNTKIGEAGLTSICRPVDIGTLQQVILLIMADADVGAKDFLIGHEVAHLAHFLKRENARLIQEDQCIWWAALSVFIVCLSIVLLPIIVDIGLILAASGCAMFISGVSCIVWDALKAPSDIEMEKNADLDSVEALQDATGGIYYFRVSQIHNQLMWHSSSSQSARYDNQGNDLEDKKHPLITERIAYLNAWQLQHLQRA